MNFPKFPATFVLGDLHKLIPEILRQIQAADKQNLKRSQDLEVGTARIILTSAAGVRVALETDDLGNITGTVL